MRLTRRQFNRGAGMLAGAAAMPPVPVSLKRGSDDAYEAIISELVRVEEAARAGGMSGSGALTATGRHLENFIGHLDMQVSPLKTAGQVWRELRAFVRERAEDTVKRAEDAVRHAVDEAARTEPDDADEVAEPADLTPTSTSPVS